MAAPRASEAFVAPAPFVSPADLQPRAARPPIEGVENAALTGRDLQLLVAATVRQQGLVGHNLDGFDDLVDRGLARIMAHHFRIDRRVRNERTQTAEDRERKGFRIRLQFSDTRVGSPVSANYLTGQFADLYPGQALLTGHPYSGAVTLGATVHLQAFATDGRVDEKVAELAPFQIGGLPCMVRSSRCHTRSCTRETLKGLGEDPADPGGYFIAKRNEYIVYLLENISYNKIHVHCRMKPNEHARAEFLSQPGGAFENSTQVRARLLTNGQLTVEINSTKLEKVLLPFWLLYRLLGMTSDREIAETIVFDADDPSPLTRQMLGALERAFQLAPPDFADLVGELDQERLVRAAGERIGRATGQISGSAFQSNESALQFLNEDLLGSPARQGGLDQVFLPHVGGGADRIRKLRFLGLILRKLLLAHFGAVRFTDRDSYRNKRAHGAGVSLAKAFKTQVNSSVIVPILRALRRNLRNSPWESLNEAAIVDIVHGALAT
ncbi:MAG TPA: hypothetical protein VNI01_09870, partial [Elusimicrobiota bacterium]|nr:hypothetical protein [Elusimicrobiota bacterium]